MCLCVSAGVCPCSCTSSCFNASDPAAQTSMSRGHRRGRGREASTWTSKISCWNSWSTFSGLVVYVEIILVSDLVSDMRIGCVGSCTVEKDKASPCYLYSPCSQLQSQVTGHICMPPPLKLTPERALYKIESLKERFIYVGGIWVITQP